MNISKWKVAWSFLTGGGSKVADYLLGLLKQALDNLSNPTKEKLQAVLNFALKILSVLQVVKIFVPVKWQTAYLLTVKAVESVVSALTDLNVTGAELQAIIKGYDEAVAAWLLPDDGTCVDKV